MVTVYDKYGFKIGEKIDVFEAIRRNLTKVEDDFHKMERKIKRLETRNENRFAAQSGKIIRDIIALTCQGYDEETAIKTAYDRYTCEFPLESIKYLWKSAVRQKNALNLYARIFMAKKMKESGYSSADISCTLGVSIPTVHKMLKADIILEYRRHQESLNGLPYKYFENEEREQ